MLVLQRPSERGHQQYGNIALRLWSGVLRLPHGLCGGVPDRTMMGRLNSEIGHRHWRAHE